MLHAMVSMETLVAVTTEIKADSGQLATGPQRAVHLVSAFGGLDTPQRLVASLNLLMLWTLTENAGRDTSLNIAPHRQPLL